MQIVELKSQFISWVETKIKKEFYITNPFLIACLDEKLELSLNSTINGIPFYEHFNNDEFMTQILEGWESNVKGFFAMTNPNLNVIFRGIKLPDTILREELNAQINLLTLESKSSL